MANKHEVAVIVGMLAETFGRPVSDVLIESYFIGIGDLPVESLNTVVSQVLRGDFKFMPRPGELRALVLTGGKTYESRAEMAWHEFDRAVMREGGDHSVTFKDGLINAAVCLCGGWIQCCEKVGDEYSTWLQKQFKETYIRLCQSGASEEMRRPLIGRLELANSGFPDRILSQLKAYTGRPIEIATSQPVIAPPTEAPKRIVDRSNGAPQIDLRKP